MKYVAAYRIHIGHRLYTFWIRPEFASNTIDSATRFVSLEAAQAELDRISRQHGSEWRTPRIEQTEE